MHRFLNRTKDKAPAADQPTVKKTKKGKKAQEEVKPDFDLSSALPAANDFRTSLILPGLSTRFSMLREQDDPNSKIGKASDDSVLQPKRQSRLQEFGFGAGGLSDISEVSSLHGSIRPPLSSQGRAGSINSQATGDESGSVMTRARPCDGNILFGGRQKIYMIPNNSLKGHGRILYDDDVNLSTYQRLRMEEKEKLRMEAEELNDHYTEPSSPTALSQKRETSSSTNSVSPNARTSTAATSIASQGAGAVSASSPAIPSAGPLSPVETSRVAAKPRRLYDQGLDQHIQDQQSSAMSRLNSIQRARAPTGRSTPPIPLSQARSTPSLNDRFHRGPAFRSDSPNSMGHSGVLRNNSQLSSAGSSPVIPQSQSSIPGSPVLSDSDEHQPLNAALQPHDRGKATAMGAFNKPKEAFSEHQYAERMKRMQKEREVHEVPTPKVAKSPPRSPPRKTLRERAAEEQRKRAISDASRQRFAEPRNAPAAFSVFQAAANRMKTTDHALQSPPPAHTGQASPGAESSVSDNVATFLSTRSSSDDEEPASRPTTARTEVSRRFENLPVATGPAPSIFEHPAMRSRTPSDDKVAQLKLSSRSPTVPQAASEQPENVCNGEVDSPTLGPNGGGLSGLIRQHLRNDSNVSSNYDDSDAKPLGLAIQTQDVGRGRQPASESTTPAPSTYSHSNPWDLDDLDNPYRDEHGSINSASSVEPQKPTLGSQWENNSKRNHERVASNETEADHEAFQRDLAHRQRLIQENLRVRAEGRSLSPAPGGNGGLKNALNMLRAKSSRESFAVVGQLDAPPKSLRKLTLGTSTNASTTSLSASEHWKAEIPSLRTKTSRLLQQSDQDAQREYANRQRSPTDSSTRTGRPVGRSAMSTRSSTRDRSGSGTSSGRSQSRSDHQRGDLEQAMLDGSRGSVYPPNTMPSVAGYSANTTPPLPTDRPSLDAQNRARSRSNSYFESKHLQPIQTGAHPPLPAGSPNSKYPISPRPSPNGLGNNTFSSQPSPVPPFATHTPPTSNPTTPNAAAFNPSAAQPFIRQGVLRKKSIAKSEISDPVFVSTTSVIDTVDLPPGASLKNGAEPFVPPPVPPINPMRRRFGFGRSETSSPQETTSFPDFEPPRTGQKTAASRPMDGAMF